MNFDFHFGLYEIKSGEQIATKVVSGTNLGTVLEQIAKTVAENGGAECVAIRITKARLNEHTTVVDAIKMESLNTIMTLATEHYCQKADKQAKKLIESKKKIIENLKTIVANPQKLEMLATKALAEASDQFTAAKNKQAELDAELKKHSDHLNSFPKGDMNLTPDHVKATPEWKTAKQNADRAFSNLRNFNSAFTKTHKKELAAERKNRGKTVNELELPDLDSGDVLLAGKFKNKKCTITGFDTDENNQPVAQTDRGVQQIFKPRVAKLMNDKSTRPFA